MCLQSHIYKNIPVSFDFITTWNQGLFVFTLYIYVYLYIGILYINPVALILGVYIITCLFTYSDYFIGGTEE